jgi:hypothetical protein
MGRASPIVEEPGENLLWVVSPTFLLGAGGGDGSERPRRSIRATRERLGAAYRLYEKDSLLYGCYSLNNEQHIS